MAISVLRKTSPHPFLDGQNGMYIQFFNCAFSTTDLTGTVPSGLRKVAYRSPFSLLQEADDVIAYNDTNNADGTPVLATGEKLTISRGSIDPTSGLKFGFFIVGFV